MTGSSIVTISAAIAVGLAGSPQLAAPSDYHREVGPRYVVENCGGRTTFVAKNPMVVRLERFALENGCAPSLAPELAELLAECKYPRVMAAIAWRESRFNPKARGAVGERGMYQVRPEVWGDPGRSVHSQTEKTEKVLLALIDEHGGLSRAVERYNGSGTAAKRYREQVLATARSI